MAEDRFANIFTARVVMSAANTLTFNELVFGITLRDRVAIVIDQAFFWVNAAALGEMTTSSDRVEMALTVSDQVTAIGDMNDRRVMFGTNLIRHDLGTAASSTIFRMPLKEEFLPPLIILPNRVFFGVDTNGLASAATCYLRLHYRTVSITQDRQLIEVLEAFQLAT